MTERELSPPRSGSTAAPEVVQTYVGTSPFEHLNDEVDLGLGTAMYDLMGKATGLPCHKLFGARCRQWVYRLGLLTQGVPGVL